MLMKENPRDFNRAAKVMLIAVVEVFAGVPDVAPSYAFVLGQQVGAFIITYGLFLIAMCFRKNGLSGWVSMLASEDYVREHVKSSDSMSE